MKTSLPRDKFSALSHLYKAQPAAATGHTPAMITTTEFRVRYSETDQMGVVYHANYLVWCEIGRTDFIRELGTPYAELERSNVALAVVEASLRFHAPARYDDRIRVRTSLRDARSRMITFDYVIENADTQERLVTASTTLASLTRESRPASLPPELRRTLQNALS
jgi:acyl-CoA thioester hydrolase